MCCSHSSSDEIRAANSGEWDRVPGGGDEVIVLLNRRLVGSDRFVATHYKRVLLAATPSCSFAIVCCYGSLFSTRSGAKGLFLRQWRRLPLLDSSHSKPPSISPGFLIEQPHPPLAPTDTPRPFQDNSIAPIPSGLGAGVNGHVMAPDNQVPCPWTFEAD